MENLAIYGAGGFGREVAWLSENSRKYSVTCFIDDDSKTAGKQINGIPVLGFEETIKKFPGVFIVMALGSPKTRQVVVEKITERKIRFADLIHPNTTMSNWIEIGKGVVICAGCILTTNIHIGNHVQINLDCTIGHDVVMDDYTTLAPGVHVSGWVHFGKRVYVGTGAVFINGTEREPLTIGEDAVIGAGAVVTKSIPRGQTWGGVPAKNLHSK